MKVEVTSKIDYNKSKIKEGIFAVNNAGTIVAVTTMKDDVLFEGFVIDPANNAALVCGYIRTFAIKDYTPFYGTITITTKND